MVTHGVITLGKNHLILADSCAFVHKQTVSWLTSAPSVLKDCIQALSSPDDLTSLLQHHKCLEHLGTQGKPDALAMS